jgi:ribosome-associated protein
VNFRPSFFLSFWSNIKRKRFVMEDVPIKNGLVIPKDEIEIRASRAGGPGGQHVNKSNTRITVRWNLRETQALTGVQKLRVEEKLASVITEEGDIIIHSASSRSQLQNKEEALERLADKIRKALYVPKRRMKTKVSKAKKEARLQAKTRKGQIKKLRGKVSLD